MTRPVGIARALYAGGYRCDNAADCQGVAAFLVVDTDPDVPMLLCGNCALDYGADAGQIAREVCGRLCFDTANEAYQLADEFYVFATQAGLPQTDHAPHIREVEESYGPGCIYCDDRDR